MAKEQDNPRFVLKSECDESMNQIRLALFGSDLRGGMVKDIHDIKSTVNTASTFVSKVVVPIGTAIASSVVTALILAYAFHLL